MFNSSRNTTHLHCRFPITSTKYVLWNRMGSPLTYSSIPYSDKTGSTQLWLKEFTRIIQPLEPDVFCINPKSAFTYTNGSISGARLILYAQPKCHQLELERRWYDPWWHNV